MSISVEGRVVRGLRAAFGASRIMRRGTIKLQLPHFRMRIPELDTYFDGPLHAGTTNAQVPQRNIRVIRPAFFL